VMAASALFLIVLAAVLAPVICRYDPDATDIQAILAPPSASHWFGTDQLGRDMFSRIVYGARLSPLAAGGAVCIAGLIGIPFGVLAGYFGGRTDTMMSRVVDGMMAVPGLIFVLTVVAVLGPGLANLTLAIGLLLAPTFYRVSRAAVMDVRNNVYIEGSIAIGCTTPQTVLRHVMPNASAPILVQATLAFAIAVVAEAGLSFLGLGARPPAASWGQLLASATERMDQAHLLYFPAGALLLTVGCATILGDVLRDLTTGRRA